MIPVLFWLIVGHAVADYILQSAPVSRDKNRHLAPAGLQMWPYAMAAHCLTNAGAVALATGSVYLGMAEFGAHCAIDMARCEKWTSRPMDQGLHLLCKVAWVLLWSMT